MSLHRRGSDVTFKWGDQNVQLGVRNCSDIWTIGLKYLPVDYHWLLQYEMYDIFKCLKAILVAIPNLYFFFTFHYKLRIPFYTIKVKSHSLFHESLQNHDFIFVVSSLPQFREGREAISSLPEGHISRALPRFSMNTRRLSSLNRAWLWWS